MTKLSNGIELTNSFLKPEFAEYLLSNGFDVKPVPAKNIIFFESKDRRLEIVEERCNFYQLKTDEPDQVIFYHSFFGFSRFTIFEWILLMHITGALSLSEFIDNSAMGGDQLATETKFLVNNLLKSLTETVKVDPFTEAFIVVQENIATCNQGQFVAVQNLIDNFEKQYPQMPDHVQQLRKAFELKKNPPRVND
jgi:hypothetical protein